MTINNNNNASVRGGGGVPHHNSSQGPRRMQLRLGRFKMTSITFPANESKGPIVVMIGRRGTGKSMLVKDLMYHHQDVPQGIVISGTELGNHFYAPLAPKAFIFHEYESTLVENLFRRQLHVLQPENRHEAPDARVFLLLDDCMYDDSWSRDKLMRCVFMNGRHWKIMCVITMQYPLGVPPVLRTNIDFAFLLFAPTMGERRRLYDNYASCFESFEAFNAVFNQTTAHFECMVVCFSAHSNDLSDLIKYYKAVERPNYRLMNAAAWAESARLGSGGGARGDVQPYDNGASNKRKRGPDIEVVKGGGGGDRGYAPPAQQPRYAAW